MTQFSVPVRYYWDFEGGWVNAMILRNFEHLIGYTTPSAEFVAACK